MMVRLLMVGVLVVVCVCVCVCVRARKLYTSARIYEWKFVRASGNCHLLARQDE